MNNLPKCIIFGIFIFLFNSNAFSQSVIKGKISDQIDSTAVPFVSVILYQYQSNKIIDFTQTDGDGNYQIETPSKLSILTIKTSRLGYYPFQQDVVFGSKQDETILLNLYLLSKKQELNEVVVKGPIIIKEDTIIYNVRHYTEARDQNLEDVLSKIPGFKIGGDGQIGVNGKIVNKVLIDGQEVSDAGAALLTRSISPEDVESVEVRMDEKNSKLKESLLDATKYVVLDIKLKDELEKSLFGKVRGTTGYQNEIELGGYLNAFSLRKNAKFHFFAEHDRFGEQTISLDQIKNLGSEAFQKLFDLPADFSVLAQRERFDDELFGFNDYTVTQKDVIGLSTKFTISPSIDIYFGTYNFYSKDGKGRKYEQDFTNFDLLSNFLETRELVNFSSKNKIDVRYDTDKLKVKLDINAVFFDDKLDNDNLVETQNLNYRYRGQHQSISFYENLLVEYKISKKSGLQFKTSHSLIHSDQYKKLNHNNPTYSSLFTDEQGRTVFDFKQQLNIETTNLLSQISFHHRSKLGALNLGFYYQSKDIKSKKDAVNNQASFNNKVFDFTGNQFLSTMKRGFFLKHRIGLGNFVFRNEGRWVDLRYPNQDFRQATDKFLDIKSNLTFSPSGFDYISASFSRRLSQFPLGKLLPGAEITSFQSVVIPQQSAFSPQPEMTIELSGAKKFQDVNILFDPAILYGQVRNSNRYLLLESPVVSIAYDQLKAEYILLTFPITKNFAKIPVDIVFEPEWLVNQSQNVDDEGINYTTRTTRGLLGFKFNTQLEDKPYDLFLYPKYSTFTFMNELSDVRTTQEMLSLDISVYVDFLEKRFLLTPSMRTVKFLGNVDSNFTNISLRADFISSRCKWFLFIDNILNDSNFIRQTIYPTYFTSEQNFVFSRFFKVGMEYKLK